MELLQKIIDSQVKLTPMMQQYVGIKERHREMILAFRMGDFYEMFFDDACAASKILNITLTNRGKVGDFKIPMCGIPHHAAANYIDRLTNMGKKVAICEQIENPAEACGVVKRAVTQIVSPGMPFDIEKSNNEHPRYIGSGVYVNSIFYLVFLDFTTGNFFGLKANSANDFIDKIKMYAPKEFVTYLGQWEEFSEISQFIQTTDILLTKLKKEHFNTSNSSIYLKKLIPRFERDEIIKMEKNILLPASALSYYVCSTQSLDELVHIRPFRLLRNSESMRITLPTLTGLGIKAKEKNNYAHSIQGMFDRTLTAMGKRELDHLFNNPTVNIATIKNRQNLQEYFLSNLDRQENIRENLKEIRDIDRIMCKISTKKVTASDLINLAKSILEYDKIKNNLDCITSSKVLTFIDTKYQKELSVLANKILKSINDEVGASSEKGNLIKSGIHRRRDSLSKIQVDRNGAMLELEKKYRKSTAIQNLKIKFNNICGYYIEISKSHLAKVPKNFVRRQTLVNAERFITPKLREFEQEIILAKEKLERVEREIFNNIVSELSEHSFNILLLAKLIGNIDLFQGLAWVAHQQNLVRPQFATDNGVVFQVEGAWHPLIKNNINEEFVCHNLTLTSEIFFGLITGPNMAGKTTVMREMAIIQFLAQIGCFVPATKATLGISDFIFSRLGASDDITHGQSTFMVEMNETAEILRHASNRSFIILDEVGRGTSTHDGLSIAWAIVEHLLNSVKAITLFSTHYHELIEVANNHAAAKNLTVETINNDGEVQFLYNLIEEGATESFGIYVAKLAGLPKSLLERAQEILNSLEKKENTLAPGVQLSFLPPTPKSARQESSKLEKILQEIDVMQITPLQAMQKLHELKCETKHFQ